MERDTVRGEGICPRCGGLGRYSYVVEGPVHMDLGDVGVRVKYTYECMTCEFKEDKNVIVPLSGFYPLRYMLDPKFRVILERIRLLANIKNNRRL